MAMKKRKSSTTRTASRTSSRKAKAGGKKASKKASKKAKTRPKSPKAAADAGAARTSQPDAPSSVPVFLTTRQFKKLAETTRRQRISQARTKSAGTTDAGRPRVLAAPAAMRSAAKRKVWDYSVGFDPQEDD